MLIYCEGIAEGKREDFKMLSTLTSSGRFDPEILFPRWFDIPNPVEPTTTTVENKPGGEPVDDANTEFDYSGVKWELPSDGDKAAMAQLAQIMSGNAGVSVSGDDGQGSDQGFPLDFTPDDREWV